MRLILLMSLCIGLCGCAVNAVTGKKNLNFMSPSEQIAMGEKNYGPYQQQQGGRYTVDPALNQYVKQVGLKLAAASDQPNLPYDFVVLNDDTPNAWALPGGKIAVNRGLLVLLDDEAQLAAVLGHEIVHAAAGHSAQQQSRSTLIGLGAAILTAATSDSNYSPLIGAGVGLGAGAAVAHYSRDQELEADEFGIKYMSRAGYDPKAAVELQEKFVELSKSQSRDALSALFASHPPSEDRVNRNRNTIAQYPAGKRNQAEYKRGIAQLTRDADAYKTHVAAVKAASQKNYPEALALTDQAISRQGREAQFYITRGRILMAQDKTLNASNAFKRATQENPDYALGYLFHGMAEKKLGSTTTAKASLQRSMELLPTPVGAYFLGEIARDSGDRTNARRYFEFAAQDTGEIGNAARGQLQQLQ